MHQRLMIKRCASCAAESSLGASLIEVMVALLIFATAMGGIVTTQLAGKRAAHEALQRSVAALLAGDMLERMRGNPGQLAVYAAHILGDRDAPISPPAADCTLAVCSPAQLASYDLWQWESLLLGEAEREGEYRLGGLLNPRACVAVSGSRITLALSWRGPTASLSPVDFACGSDSTGIYDAPGHPPGNRLLRRVLTVSTAVMAVSP